MKLEHGVLDHDTCDRQTCRRIDHVFRLNSRVKRREWAVELPSYGQSRKWLMEQRRKILTWDPDYVPEEEPVDELEEIETELESDEEREEEIKPSPPPKIVPTSTTICPRCSKRFEPEEVTQYTDFGVRCPHCSQSIVLR